MYITPCIGICTINSETKVCEGCSRTIEEIASWRNYSDEKRMEVMKRLGYGKRKRKANSRI